LRQAHTKRGFGRSASPGSLGAAVQRLRMNPSSCPPFSLTACECGSQRGRNPAKQLLQYVDTCPSKARRKFFALSRILPNDKTIQEMAVGVLQTSSRIARLNLFLLLFDTSTSQPFSRRKLCPRKAACCRLFPIPEYLSMSEQRRYPLLLAFSEGCTTQKLAYSSAHCLDFKRNKTCRRGDGCPYSHG
jgi:hypothetical protein